MTTRDEITARAALEAESLWNCPRFWEPAACAAVCRQLAPLFRTEAYTHARRHNIYFRKTVPGLAPDHPALAEVETINHTLAHDQLTGTALDSLYRDPEFAGLLARVMGKEALYRMADPMAGLNVMEYRHGDALNWHFDRSEFTTTLLLQIPDSGGMFQYSKDLRSETDPNYGAVARLLSGAAGMVTESPAEVGTLTVFRGVNTAHRVTPVQGATSRIVAVFSFFDRPGVRFTAQERKGFYGRA